VKTYLTILGCGSSMGVPRADGFWGACDKTNVKNYRTRCSALISRGKNNILIDTSPDLRSQLLENKIVSISSVIYSHQHADQTHGINDLRIFYHKNKKKINIYANKDTLNFLKRNFTYCFKNSLGYPPIIKANKLKRKNIFGSGKELINIESFEVDHGRIKSIGFVIKKTAYISDCNKFSISNLKRLKNLEYFIIDCLRYKSHPSHFSLSEVLNVVKFIKPKQTILTNLHTDLDYNILLKKIPINVKPAFDGMKLII